MKLNLVEEHEQKRKKFKIFDLKHFYSFGACFRFNGINFDFGAIQTFKEINQIDNHFVFELTNKWDNEIFSFGWMFPYIWTLDIGHIAMWNMNMLEAAPPITVTSLNPQILLDPVFSPAKCYESKMTQRLNKNNQYIFKHAIQRHLCMYLLLHLKFFLLI